MEVEEDDGGIAEGGGAEYRGKAFYNQLLVCPFRVALVRFDLPYIMKTLYV